MEIDGVDTALALKNANGNEALVKRLLGRFRDTERSFCDRAREALAAGRRAEVARWTHDLRSTSGSLGMTELVPLALAFETALNDDASADLLEAHLQALCVRLGTMILALEQLR